MGKNQSASGLTNIIQYDNNGNVSFVSGSTTLMQISSSGAITTTGVISGSNALSASFSLNSGLLNETGSVGFATTASLLTVSSSQQQISASQQQISSSLLALTASYNALSSSYTALSASYNTFSGSASTRITANSSSIQQVSSSLLQVSASYTALSGSYNTYSGSASTRVTQIEQVYATTGSNSFRANQSITGSLVVSSTITAQTLVVQTVTSSIVFSSGSNTFGCDLNSRQTFTGSMFVTGSLIVNTTGPELQVNNNGVILGNLLTDNHSITGSLRITGSSVTIAGTLSGTTIHGSTTICGGAACFTGNVCVGGTTLLRSSVQINDGTAGTSPKLVFGNEDVSLQGHKSIYLEGFWMYAQVHYNEGFRIRAVNGLSSSQTIATFSGASGNLSILGAFSGTSAILSSRLGVGISTDQTYASMIVGGDITLGVNQYALILDPQLSGTSNSYAIFANARIKANTAVTNAFGVYIPSAEKISGATITNNYALYIANQTSGATLNYSIYSSGGLNYFGGNVGIGTTTPATPLQVAGASVQCQGLLNISNTHNGGGVYFPAAKIRNTRGDHSYGIVSEFSIGSVGGVDRSSILFYSDACAHSWNVGQVTSAWGVEDSFGIGYRANNSPSTFTGWPTNYFSITTSGISCFAGTVCAPCFATISDYRMKSNVRPIEGLSIIMNTKPYKFEYNYDCSTSFGMIAHELQDTVPEAVFGYKDGEVMQGVDYMKLLPIAIKAIQEQQCKIALLESCLGIA